MEILFRKDSGKLLDYLPRIQSSLREWRLIDVRLLSPDKHFTPADAANSIDALFKDKDGKIYICNDNEALALLHWGENGALAEITENVQRCLLADRCEVHAREPTPEGLIKLKTLAEYKEPNGPPSMADIRGTRRQNVILLADDDMFMRILVKNAISSQAATREVEDGNEIMAAYMQYVPDILFLDIHMPNREGTVVLGDILAADPAAYVVMLSADGSQENIETAMRKGAKAFLTKPFTKDQLMEYIQKCPTIS
ncbi:MAG: response regulator [Alphaproteobacteria bacterium]